MEGQARLPQIHPSCVLAHFTLSIEVQIVGNRQMRQLDSEMTDDNERKER